MIEFLKKLIKEYGSAIGPILAFIFGILTMLLKYKIDQIVAKRSIVKSFEMLKKLINDSNPPSYFFSNISDRGLMHADEARNITNIARFYNKLLSIKSVIETIDGDITQSRDIGMVRQYHSIKWCFNILIKDVEDARNEKRIKSGIFHRIQEDFKYLTEATTSVDKLYSYIEPKKNPSNTIYNND